LRVKGAPEARRLLPVVHHHRAMTEIAPCPGVYQLRTSIFECRMNPMHGPQISLPHAFRPNRENGGISLALTSAIMNNGNFSPTLHAQTPYPGTRRLVGKKGGWSQTSGSPNGTTFYIPTPRPSGSEEIFSILFLGILKTIVGERGLLDKSTSAIQD
jgi:hypothetical protein